jgi:hypothetical protein
MMIMKAGRPKMLFKFSPSSRFLDDSLFRFSQPSALNDPHEALPELLISEYSEEDLRAARAKVAADGMRDIDDDMLINFFLKSFPSARMDEKSFPGLWPAREPRLREAPFDSLRELDKAVAERLLELTIGEADKSFGILSLSESNHEALWAYYANDHSGLCITFNAEHEYFENSNILSVEYSARPIYISSNDGWLRFGGHTVSRDDVLNGKLKFIPLELLGRKQMPWSHEKEWRLVRSLLEADKIIPQTDGISPPICLFRIPPEAISGLTFGYKASHATIESVSRSIHHDPKWHHLKVRQRVRKPNGIVINQPLFGGDPDE